MAITWLAPGDGGTGFPPIERCLVDAFCELIRSGCINHDWLKLSLQTQQVCDALLKSARSGVVESL